MATTEHSMTDPSDVENMRSGSTTFVWRRIKMARPPEAIGQARRSRSFWRLPRWDPRKPLTVTIKYRGGEECWYEVHSRGATLRVPGYVQLHDLAQTVYGGGGRPQ